MDKVIEIKNKTEKSIKKSEKNINHDPSSYFQKKYFGHKNFNGEKNMAKPIADTPALEGKEAYDFLKRMTKSATKEELKLAKELNSLKRVVPFPD